jgi:glycosyltransferase involved in cell wall biosynthesis
VGLKLSICIPTYNRLAELKANLALLIPQVAAQPTGTVEIVIVNNASTDGTAEFIDALPGQHAFVRAFHNPTNLGFDGNTAKCIEYAAGEYTALLSDDDRYLEGQVAAILDVVSKRDYALLALNYYSFIKDVRRVYRTYVPERDVMFSDARGVLSHGWVGHLSGLIYRSEPAKETLSRILEEEPLTASDRSRGIYFEVALRMANANTLPAYYIGARRLAARIPDSVDYDEIQNMGVDTCRFFRKLYDEGVITSDDLAFRYNSVMSLLPSLAIRCTPSMSVDEIARVTRELEHYLSEYPRFRTKGLPLLRAARYSGVRWFYRASYNVARQVKRTLKGTR